MRKAFIGIILGLTVASCDGSVAEKKKDPVPDFSLGSEAGLNQFVGNFRLRFIVDKYQDVFDLHPKKFVGGPNMGICGYQMSGRWSYRKGKVNVQIRKKVFDKSCAGKSPDDLDRPFRIEKRKYTISKIECNFKSSQHTCLGKALLNDKIKIDVEGSKRIVIPGS